MESRTNHNLNRNLNRNLSFGAQVLALALMVSSSASWAMGLDGKSAARQPGVSYRAYKAFAHVMGQGQTPPTPTTPVDLAKKFGGAVLPAATVWNNEAEMNQNFARFRDNRFLDDGTHPNFPRRSSWLYPDDGCFARAALAIRTLGQWAVPVPSKVFVFGDLNVKTSNSPTGEVSWWYHVAPLVEVGGEKYVLDPAIEPKNPLKLADWLARMSTKPEDLEVAVCGSGSYTPYDVCARDTDGIESSAMNDQIYYLGSEWSRVVELGRDPNKDLGDLPPWLDVTPHLLGFQ